MSATEFQNSPHETLKRGPGNPNWVEGGPSPNPGGKPKKLREIEKMLDEEHRNVSVMREVFSRLKALALGEVVAIAGKDGEVHLELRADPAFMKLYLDRVLGPVKELITDDDLRDAPDAVIDWLRRAA